MQGLARQVFHGDVGDPFVFTELVDGDDVAVAQRGRGGRLAPEARQQMRVRVTGQHLDSHEAVYGRIQGAEDLAAAAPAQFFLNLVFPDLL